MKVKMAVVICNWNGKDWLIRCIRSLLSSSLESFELIVVDNASTDGSVDAIIEQFGDKIKIIANKENKGGSGGFNTGIRIALEKGYKYIHLLDNDVIVHPKAIEELFYFMEKNSNVAAAGSKIYSFDQPNQLQELGASINWNEFNIRPNYKGYIDDETIPELIECDYVPACSVMVRTEAIKKAGLMDESFFIYWDDIEWFYRMKLAGYRIVANSRSKVWHKMGAANKTNTFSTYYFWRNRINFFLNYLDDELLESFAKQIIKETFQAVYMCNYNKQYNVAKTILLAIEDALKGLRGKAPEGRIFEREKTNTFDQFAKFVNNEKRIVLIPQCEFRVLQSIVGHIGEAKIEAIVANNEDKELLELQFPTINIRSVYEKGTLPSIAVYNHVLDADFTNDIDLYVDQYFNVVQSEEDRHYMANYKTMYQIYQNIYFPVLKQRFLDWREK
ncbi:glycosyltransferase family 2 protein [Geobacillus sp. TFV-3]|uniref:glycosyltransferase family 2 protein n=1 Tax=Geobacillus sp. TFV-3 TaxID=1897059 RepID=UPI00135A350E|nr:glycosyltransferase family 2 protein [Geobacillus sp. TFV-3]KAF0996457.1 putative glycosyltransferase EpsE [Geobacillus sp. TFV-3]